MIIREVAEMSVAKKNALLLSIVIVTHGEQKEEAIRQMRQETERWMKQLLVCLEKAENGSKHFRLYTSTIFSMCGNLM